MASSVHCSAQTTPRVQAEIQASQEKSGTLATTPGTPAAIAARFTRADPRRITNLLETLVSYGQARRTPDGAYRL